MTEKHEDTARLEYLVKNLNTVANSVHIATRPDKGIMQMYCWLSEWVEMPLGEKVDLDDLRMLIDEAITKEKQR